MLFAALAAGASFTRVFCVAGASRNREDPEYPSSAGRHRWRRNGFTVVEMLICFAIIVVLISLLIPAVLRAKTAALQTHCQNNIRQINLAMAMYHDVHETFPPGYVARDVEPSDGSDVESGPGFAWATFILGYLEQSTLAATIDFNTNATDPGNFGVSLAPVSSFLCPAGQSEPSFILELDWGPMTIGSSNYVGMLGFGSLTDQPGEPPAPGILYRNSHVSIVRIIDGTSNTILIGERVGRYPAGVDTLPVESNSTWFAAVPGAFRFAGLQTHPDAVEGPASLVLGSIGQDHPFPLELHPNQTTHIGALSSSHEGGFHAGMADSSVRFISDSADFEALRRLAVYSDRKPVGEF